MPPGCACARNRGVKSKPFVDTVEIHVAAGQGGDGSVSFRREKHVPRGGPDGGDGGRGGHVYLEADQRQDSLTPFFFSPNLHAERGGNGSGKRRHGRNGRDRVGLVPLGTVIRDETTQTILGELTVHGERLLVAKGGGGGLGNCHWVTPSHRAPREHTDGEPGGAGTLRLEMKTIADVGLVGIPNAGKSSLLDSLTRAHSRVGAYPFTTLHPVIGVLKRPDHGLIRIADIPGLIHGAHRGHGLGIAFLRHIERASCLLMVIDISDCDERKPAADYNHVMEELGHYDITLPKRVAMIVANKMDLPGAQTRLRLFKRQTGRTAFPVSSMTGSGIDELKKWLFKTVPPAQNG